MKTKIAILTLGTVLLTALAIGCEPAPSGDPLPEISGTTYEHGEFQLTAQTDKPIVVNFWYPSCPPCVQELPDFQTAYETYGDRVDFLGIFLPILEDENAAKSFLQNLGVGFPNLTDEDSSTVLDYSIVSFPTTLFINADKTEIVRRFVGGPIPLADLEMLIEELL